MLMPGPSTTATPWARASRPSASPTRRASPGSQDEARAQAVTRMAGMPRRSTAAVCQKPEPRHSDAFSSRVSWASNVIGDRAIISSNIRTNTEGSKRIVTAEGTESP